MLIVTMLRSKGDFVATVAPATRCGRCSRCWPSIGSAPWWCPTTARDIDGIVSERDIVRRIRDLGDALLDQPVSAIMTRDVVTCAPRARSRS